jgi:hypothetical protein
MQSGYTAAAAFVQPTRRRSRPATLQRARTTLRPAGVTSMCQVMRSAGRAGTVTGTGACFSIGSPYPNGCKWRRSRRFSGCVSPSPSGVDRSADGPGDGPVVRLDDSEFRRNGNVRTEMTAATGFGHACTVRAGPGAGADVRSTRSSRWPHLARFPPGDGDPARRLPSRRSSAICGRAAARRCPRGRCSTTYVLLPTPSRLRGGIGRPNT